MERASVHKAKLASPKPVDTLRGSILQRHGNGQSQPASVPPIVHEVLRSPGQPLDAETRAFMEPRFGQDFSKVRVHADQRVAELSISKSDDPSEQDAEQTAHAVMRMPRTPAGPSRDFSRVRIHTDRMAAESAGVVNARAYTVGHHVVFGREQYSPGSEAGRRLLGHELFHVVQQQSTGVAKVQRQSTSLTDAPQKPLRRGPLTAPIKPPPEKYLLTKAQADVENLKLHDPKELTKGEVKGAAPGSDAEIFLWYILSQVATHERWGTENDLVAPIGWPPKEGSPSSGPVAAVTVSIDENGVGVAELVSTKAVEPTQIFSGSLEKAKASLAVFYDLAAVKDGDASWSLLELNSVAGAFALLPEADKMALVGVELKRVAVIDAGQKTPAQFVPATPSLEVANSTFIWDRGTPTQFNIDKAQFVGGSKNQWPGSYQTILHEVGHAVAGKAWRDAHLTDTLTTVQYDATYDAADKAHSAAVSALQERDRLYDEYSKKFDELEKAKLEQEPDAKRIKLLTEEVDKKLAQYNAKDESLKILNTALEAKNVAVDAALKKRTKAEQGVVATRISAQAVADQKKQTTTLGSAAAVALKAAQSSITGKDASVSATYRSAVAAVSAEATAYAADIEAARTMQEAGTVGGDAKVVLHEKALEEKAVQRKSERDALTKAAPGDHALTAFTPVEAAQDAWVTAVKTLGRLPNRTLRVQHFVDMVEKANRENAGTNAKKIEPITQYAKDEWPHNPGEFFAESFSYWLTDPDYLKTNARPVFDWFEAGHHRD